MSKPIKRVLLTNDDGWRGPGLKVLEEIAAQRCFHVHLGTSPAARTSL